MAGTVLHSGRFRKEEQNMLASGRRILFAQKKNDHEIRLIKLREVFNRKAMRNVSCWRRFEDLRFDFGRVECTALE